MSLGGDSMPSAWQSQRRKLEAEVAAVEQFGAIQHLLELVPKIDDDLRAKYEAEELLVGFRGKNGNVAIPLMNTPTLTIRDLETSESPPARRSVVCRGGFSVPRQPSPYINPGYYALGQFANSDFNGMDSRGGKLTVYMERWADLDLLEDNIAPTAGWIALSDLRAVPGRELVLVKDIVSV